jgi:hypothetical protein
MSRPATKAPSLIDQAKRMAGRDGLGFEDIAVKLKLAPSVAYWFVFGKPCPRHWLWLPAGTRLSTKLWGRDK